MRASTLFAIIVALLIGLGAAAAAKTFGLFDRKVEEAPVVIEQRRAVTNVLVAAVNLYPDIYVTANQVVVRELRADEAAFYEANKSKLLPAVPSSAHLRKPKKNILADTILTTDLLEDASIPAPWSNSLPADYRAVNVAVSKQNSAGGVLRVGEIVDVLLTSQVSVVGKGTELRTATIARGCKIIMKRDNIFTVLRSDPSDKPLEFTLQANTYRASLIEFSKYKGVVSLQPAPGPGMMMTTMEDQMKITEMNQGNYAVGDKDLIPVFNVTPQTPAIAPDQTRILLGSSPARTNVFPSKEPQPFGQWFFIGPSGSYGGNRLSQSAVSSANLLVNPVNGQIYDPNDKNDPNNPGCTTCGKKQGK